MSTHELRAPNEAWGRSAASALSWTCLICGILFVIGLFVDPHRSWTGFLIGFHVLLGLAIAGPVGLAFLHLSGGRWSRSLEVVPRAMYAALPAAGALGLVLLFGVGALFEWSHPQVVEGDALLEGKAAYLNFPFFAARLVVFFAVWLLAGRAVVRASASSAPRRRKLRTSAVFLLLFAPTWSLAGIDWLQSLDPHWFSTIYALMTLAGVAVAGLAAAIILIAALDTRRDVTESQYGDLGALLLSLALFWGYIWYCQYMLVWYTNLPEETPWYVSRLGGAWGLLTKLSCILCSALPVALLMFRRVRRSRGALVRIAAVVLAGRLVDLLVLAGPPLMGETPHVGPWELAPVAGQVALFFLLALRALQRTAGQPARLAAQTRAPAIDPQADAVPVAAPAA